MLIAIAVPNHCVDFIGIHADFFRGWAVKDNRMAILSFHNSESLIGKFLLQIAVSRLKYGARVLHLLFWDTTPKNQKIHTLKDQGTGSYPSSTYLNISHC